MNDNDKNTLTADNEGLANYEYLVNHLGQCDEDMDFIIENLRRIDINGQYLASAARYLNAIDPVAYADAVRRMVALAIDRDREHRYIADLLLSIYGDDYMSRAAELSAADNNFRRMYKRLYPTSAI